jgi:nicotinate-nucleotide adenylyltransferase
MKIGIFGGTFDPVHLGHLIVAQEVLEKVELAEIRFVPTGKPWMKMGRNISPADHRLKMLELSVVGNPHFKIDTADIDRPGVTYTVDTLREMKNKFGRGAQLFFILGVDALKGFPLWKEPGEIIKLCRLVIVPRPRKRAANMLALTKAIPGIRESAIFLEGPYIGISGESIRERVRLGKTIKYLVAPGVEDYIREHKLYLNS